MRPSRVDANTIRLFGSKKTDDWQTPPDLYNKLDREFNFDFDPCPLQSTTDGLIVPWGKRNYVNPPYSKVKQFLAKAQQELDRGNAEVCVFLVFSNTDTAWFHDYIYERHEIRFIRGRLRFLDEKGVQQQSAMRPSMVVIMRR